MTAPLPNGPRAPDRAPRSAADRDRARVKLARKWAYLISSTAYVPLVHTDLERPLLEMVHELFDAVAAEPPALDLAERAGARLVALNCVDKSSLRCTFDVLGGPLLTDEDVRGLDGQPERAAKVLGALAAGFAEAIRRRTTDQQEAMCRALMEVAKKAMRAAETRRTDFGDMSTELTLLQRQLSHQLLHDALTGLPNRQFFTTRLEEVLNSGSATTLYRLELNGLPVLDEGLGGPRTDTLLTAVAVRLRTAVAGEHAMVARFDRGGFTVLQECGPDSAAPAAVVAKLAGALAEITYVADLGLAVTANVGVVQRPPHGADPVEFLQAAEIALRRAKQRGPGQWHLLTTADDTRDRGRRRLAAIMPGALETGRLAVGYRLRVDLADEHPVAVDAFPRWPEAGLAGTECVALAEETGLSPQVGRWLLHTASEQLRVWRRRSGSDLPLSVSLSPHQSAAPDLVEAVLGTLSDTALPAEQLQLAMPASEVFDGRDRAAANLAALAAEGVRTAVHDFGGDPATVARLPEVAPDTVSLSPRLVSHARGAARGSLVARSLTTLADAVHECGAELSVDDLSTAEEAAWWRRTGANTATGPVFAEPDITTSFPKE